MEAAHDGFGHAAALMAEPDDSRDRPKSKGFVPQLPLLAHHGSPRGTSSFSCDTYRCDTFRKRSKLPHMSSPVGSPREFWDGPSLLEDFLPECVFIETPREEEQLKPVLGAGKETQVAKDPTADGAQLEKRAAMGLLQACSEATKVPFQYLEAENVQSTLKWWFTQALEQHEENMRKHIESLEKRLGEQLQSHNFFRGISSTSAGACSVVTGPVELEGKAIPSKEKDTNASPSPMSRHSKSQSKFKYRHSKSQGSDMAVVYRNATRHAPLHVGCHVQSVLDELRINPMEAEDEAVIQTVAAEIKGNLLDEKLKNMSQNFDHGHKHNDVTDPAGPENALSVGMYRSLTRMRSCVEDLQKNIKPSEQPWAKELFRRLNMLATFVVCMNALVLFVDLERQGQLIASQMGQMQEYQYGGLDLFFILFDIVFSLFFFIELVIKVYVLRSHYMKDPQNVVEACIVGITVTDLLILGYSDNVVFSSLARISKIARVLRLSRVAQAFKELRILIVHCILSLRALLWSAVLLVLIMLVSALLIAQMTLLYMTENCVAESEVCSWTYLNYGSSTKAFWTMFRVTLSGGWPQWADTLVEEVSVFYSVFWFIYIVVVWFAVIRILTALFLKQTMDVAAADHATQIAEKIKLKCRFAERLRKIFSRLDKDDNGMVTFEEFRALSEDTDARAMMSVLDIDFHEIRELFYMLDDGDGEISFDEFLAGAIRIKGDARAIDQVVIMHNQNKMLCRLNQLIELVCPGSNAIAEA